MNLTLTLTTHIPQPLPTIKPANAQFGIGKKKNTGGTFEERNQLAKDKATGLDSANLLDDLANMDPEEMMKLYQESLNDPATQQMMDQYKSAFAELSNMDPELLKEQITENLSKLSSPDILDMVLESQDEVLDSMLEQGLITKEQYLQYKADPEAFRQEMSNSFAEMGKILSDPEALNAALDMMSGMSNVLGDPSAAMKSITDAFDAQLGDDDKIEEARLQLLMDPSSAGNPALAALFDNDDMKEVLNDPIKFREQVKKGQDMIKQMGAGGAGVGGANYGEL